MIFDDENIYLRTNASLCAEIFTISHFQSATILRLRILDTAGKLGQIRDIHKGKWIAKVHTEEADEQNKKKNQ